MWKIIAGIAAIGALIAAGTVAAGADDKKPSGSGVEQTIGVLAKTPTDADRLPAAAASEVKSLAPEGTDLSDTVMARKTDLGDIYLTATPEGACISLTGPDSATVQCLPTADLVHESGRPSQRLGLTGCETTTPESSPECQGAVLYGVVPSGTQKVDVDVPGGLVSNVENNVYVVTVPESQAMAKITYR